MIERGEISRSPLAGQWRCSSCGCLIELDATDEDDYRLLSALGLSARGPCPTCGGVRTFSWAASERPAGGARAAMDGGEA